MVHREEKIKMDISAIQGVSSWKRNLLIDIEYTHSPLSTLYFETYFTCHVAGKKCWDLYQRNAALQWTQAAVRRVEKLRPWKGNILLLTTKVREDFTEGPPTTRAFSPCWKHLQAHLQWEGSSRGLLRALWNLCEGSFAAVVYIWEMVRGKIRGPESRQCGDKITWL